MAINSTSLTAMNAYQNQLNMMQDIESSESDDTSSASSGGGSSFMKVLGNAIQSSADTMNKAESVEMNSLSGSGKVDMTDLITAVSNAELTLNTVVAVRDKVISAYQSIIGMSI